MGRCCFYTAGTLSLLLLVTSVTLLVARVFQKAVDQTIEKVRCVCVCGVCDVFPGYPPIADPVCGELRWHEPAEHSSCLPPVSWGWQDVET